MASPLATVLGGQASKLSALVRDLHLGTGHRFFEGQVTVTGGQGVARLAAKLAGFPRPMQDAPFRLEITPTTTGERWTREFGTATTTSYLRVQNGLLLERFGPITTVLQPKVLGDGRLEFATGPAWCLRLPLPNALSPIGRVSVVETDSRYHFDITGDLPLAGRAVRYQGWLAPQEP